MANLTPNYGYAVFIFLHYSCFMTSNMSIVWFRKGGNTIFLCGDTKKTVQSNQYFSQKM